MISQLTKLCSKQIINNSKYGFCSYKKQIYNLFNFQDPTDPNFQVANADPIRPLEGHSPRIVQNQTPRYDVSKLSNGITVLTESQVFPSNIDLSIYLDVGTRDETNETSGSLLSIKNTYYKSFLNTNETINYGMVQMAGGEFDMEYDQESAIFRAHCLQHDVVDIFNMMADCVFEPRSPTACNVAMDKGQWTHKFAEQHAADAGVYNHLMSTAYGRRGLGMPLNGLKGNLNNLHAHILQKFQIDNYTPDRVYVCAAGVENHQEFVDLCEAKLGYIEPMDPSDARRREQSEYLGGEFRQNTEANSVDLALTFETVGWTHEDIYAFQVLRRLTGSSASFSTGGPGKGMHARLTRDLVYNKHYVEAADTINFNFSDSGLFGLSASGFASNGKELLNDLIHQLRALAEPIPHEEVERAKNLTKKDFLMALEQQGPRLEESVKNLRLFNEVIHQNYASYIDRVTGDQINSAVQRAFRSNPTFIA